ncbi:GAF domain-containing protein [Sneathiella sp. P13V-1]|uniref:GAF domain-containing protein n=1 Tax=Sneathiella sp. P13V-1 TaxID=2697366 RepID=UPI00187B82CD|nr:GAF domain-containing protein [Sneathiella sp. P13V-1]MBE7638389.1 GAF domain-containing protein [Sneathiella sp. P13V-1]
MKQQQQIPTAILQGNKVELLAKSISEETEAHVTWDLARDIVEELIGARLFTVLINKEDKGLVSRVYSSDPETYPVGGSKKMEETPWGQLLLQDGIPFIANSSDDIKWAFPDHELIFSLGLGSALNVPMRLFGRTVGTLNLLHRYDFYTQEHVKLLVPIAAILAPLCLKDLE